MPRSRSSSALGDTCGVNKRVGLTGGIASGKSTVAAILAELGAVIIDSDRAARLVVEPGTPGLAAVVAEFGPGMLLPDGTLDRPALGALVFADDAARRRLEAILHPLIHAVNAAAETAAAAGVLVVHDVPLLAESGTAGGYDAVIVVDVAPQTQSERMIRDRGMTQSDADARMAAQTSRENRLAIATHVIANTGTLADLRDRVQQVYAELTA